MIKKIGQQTLMLGNSIELLPQLGGFDHLISDPPYEQRFHNSLNKKRKLRTDGREEFKDVPFEGIDKIRDSFISLSKSILSKWFIVFCSIEGTGKWAESIDASEIKFKKSCVWVKPDSTPQLNGQCPATGVECFITAWAGTGVSKWNGGGKRGVYTHLVNSKERYGKHPTEKPISLMSEIINDFVSQGETVVDPFMGSGTTLISAHRMGVSATGIEMNPDYFDVAVERLEREYKQISFFQTLSTKPKQEKLSL
jgi:site-specific DNA-methyltransferase (adenine-specific)